MKTNVIRNGIGILGAICLFLATHHTSFNMKAKEETVLLNHIAMYVHNLEKSTGFYENIFLFKKLPEPFKDGKHTWFGLGTSSALHLIEGAGKSVERNKNDHLCFSVPSLEDFITRLKANNVPYANWAGEKNAVTERPDGVQQIYFQDPDGHWIEVNNDRQ